MVKAGGVELVELQIGHPTPRAPGDRDTVATRAVWVRGVAIGFAGPPVASTTAPALTVSTMLSPVLSR